MLFDQVVMFFVASWKHEMQAGAMGYQLTGTRKTTKDVEFGACGASRRRREAPFSFVQKPQTLSQNLDWHYLKAHLSVKRLAEPSFLRFTTFEHLLYVP